MSTRRQRSKNQDPQKAILHPEHLPGYRIGKKVGHRAFEIWAGFEYVCLLQINSRMTLWAATHNAILEDNNVRFTYKTPLEAVRAYQAQLPRK